MQTLPELLPPVRAVVERVARRLVEQQKQLQASDIVSKSNSADLVSSADREAETTLRAALADILPGSGFIGEEFEARQPGEDGLYWVADPLDGTSNYLCGLPVWCVSVGLTDREMHSLLGVICAPLLNRTWTAIRGHGAACNGEPIAVRRSPPGGGIDNSMLATGFPYDVATREKNNIDYFVRMQKRFQKIRRLGSAAIDLAFVAEGVFDGMWELQLKPWDCAAGVVLVEEAGGLLRSTEGEPYRLGHDELVAAATPELLALMLATLQA